MKHQKVNDGPMVPVMAPTIDIFWLPDVLRKTLSKVERDYWGTVVYLMMVQMYLVMSPPMLGMALLTVSPMRLIGSVIVCHPL